MRIPAFALNSVINILILLNKFIKFSRLLLKYFLKLSRNIKNIYHSMLNKSKQTAFCISNVFNFLREKEFLFNIVCDQKNISICLNIGWLKHIYTF